MAGASDNCTSTVSGHGSQVPNLNPQEDYEPDGLDEGILYRFISLGSIPREIRVIWPADVEIYEEGVKNIILDDVSTLVVIVMCESFLMSQHF